MGYEFYILYGCFGTIITFLIGATYKFAKFMGKTELFMDVTKHSFYKINQDMAEMKDMMSRMNITLNNLWTRSNKMESRMIKLDNRVFRLENKIK